MRWLGVVLGIALTIVILLAMIQNMLVPRGAHSRVARALDRTVMALVHAPLPLFRTYNGLDRWLAVSAPVAVLLQLIMYVILLILSTAMVIWGLTGLTASQAVLQSGATFTTLGLVEPANTASAVAGFAAAFLGLVVVAVFIGYLMALYGAYVQRESQMARLALLAGQPPWGPAMMARAHSLGLQPSDIPDHADWIAWICDLRLNQSVNPVIARFRSDDPRRHWTVALLTVTDAAALRLSLEYPQRDPHMVQLVVESAVAARQLALGAGSVRHWDLDKTVLEVLSGAPGRPADAGLTQEQWQAGIDELKAADYPLPEDLDAVRDRFFRLRGLYAAPAYDLARRYHAVPAEWSGPRDPDRPMA